MIKDDIKTRGRQVKSIYISLILTVLTGCGEVPTPTMTPEQLFNLQTQCIAMGMHPVVETWNGRGYRVTCTATAQKETK